MEIKEKSELIDNFRDDIKEILKKYSVINCLFCGELEGVFIQSFGNGNKEQKAYLLQLMQRSYEHNFIDWYMADRNYPRAIERKEEV